MSGYWRRLLAGEIVKYDNPVTGTEHYWRWPVMFHWRWGHRLFASVSWHGIRDGVVRGQPFHPAVRSVLWIGPFGIEFGWRRQAIEDWLWRRRLRAGENRP